MIGRFSPARPCLIAQDGVIAQHPDDDSTFWQPIDLVGHQMQILVLGPRGMQEDDDTALPRSPVNHVARHHRLAHRHRAGLQRNFRLRHQGLGGIGKQKCAAKPHQCRTDPARRQHAGDRPGDGRDRRDDEGHGGQFSLNAPGKGTGRQWGEDQALGRNTGHPRAETDAEAKPGTRQHQIAPLGERNRGQRFTQEIAARSLERWPAQPPHDPDRAARRCVAPAPERRDVMAARKIAAQVEGEGRAVMPPPAKGAVPGVLDGFDKKAFPDGTLAQLLMRLVRQNGTREVPPRRLCLTATPFELRPDNWRLILQRAVATEDKADACAQESEKFLAAAKAVRLLPSPENATAFKRAADEFCKQLSPWIMRRRKGVVGNDSVLERYIRDHGPNYRDRSQKITAQVTGKDWSVALMAVEALSFMPDTGLGAQKRLRLALARGFSLASALDATGKPEKGDWQEAEEQTLSDTDQVVIRNQQEERRRERAGFWLGRLKQAAADPYAHPTLLAAVRAIEEITAHSESPEKVLVFGIFTQAMRRLTDLLNAREMIRRLMIFSRNPEAPFKTWHWPGETIPMEPQFREALHAAFQMADMRNLMGNPDIVTLSSLMQRHYDKYPPSDTS